MIVFRSLSAKMATMGVVMATIAMLFTATLIAEGTGMIIRAMLCNRAAMLFCFDLLLSAEHTKMPEYVAGMDYIRENIPVRDSWEYPIYLGNTREVTDYIQANTTYYEHYSKDLVMRASDYGALRKMLGYPEVNLEPEGYLIHCQPYVEEVLKGWDEPIQAGEYTLDFQGIRRETFAQHLWWFNGNGFILVVPDEAAEGCRVNYNIFAAKTVNPVSEAQYKGLEDTLDKSAYAVGSLTYDNFQFFSKSAEEAEVASMTAMTIFPLFYLALVLIMTAATILTIQQLDESGRYKQQYGLLHKLGMDRREMVKALRTQLTVYYGMPAIPPVLIGVPFLMNLGGTVEPGTLDGAYLFAIIGMALGLFFLIYGVYILLAYTAMKRNVIPAS